MAEIEIIEDRLPLTARNVRTGDIEVHDSSFSLWSDYEHHRGGIDDLEWEFLDRDGKLIHFNSTPWQYIHEVWEV